MYKKWHLVFILFLFSALSPQSVDNEQDAGAGNNISLPVPPCMSDNSYKRLTSNNPMKPEELEEVLFYYRILLYKIVII